LTEVFHPIQKRRNVTLSRQCCHTRIGGKEVPPYSRFYMGGENDVRGFDLRSISPALLSAGFGGAIPFTTHRRRALRTFTVPVLTYTATAGVTFNSGNVEYRTYRRSVNRRLFFDVNRWNCAPQRSQPESTRLQNLANSSGEQREAAARHRSAHEFSTPRSAA